MLGEGLTNDNDNSVGDPEKKFSINFKSKTKLCSSLHYSGNDNYLYMLLKKRFISLKVWIMYLLHHFV